MTMPTMVAIAVTVIGGATLPFALNTTPAHTAPARTVLAVPVNGDFNQFLPEHRATYADEMRQHTARLQKIEAVLRSRDVSNLPEALRAERARNLDRLNAYWHRAEYPTVPAHSGVRRPCFIDDAGRICAVGYLVEQSSGREVAERINAKYRPNTIREINDPALALWIAQSGLSYDEVVAIQGPSIQAAPIIQLSEARSGRNRRSARTERVAPANNASTVVQINQQPVLQEGQVEQNVNTMAEPIVEEEPVVEVAVQRESAVAPAVIVPALVPVETTQPASHIQ